MSWNEYIDDVVTQVATVTGVVRCERAASVDPAKLMRIPVWPKVLVTSLGFTVDPFSGAIFDGQFAVTVCKLVPAGTLGAKAAREIGTVMEAIIEDLTHTRELGEISMLANIGEQAEAANESAEVYYQTTVFEASLLR